VRDRFVRAFGERGCVKGVLFFALGLPFALLLAISTVASADDSMAIQPDGKIVLASQAWPGFGALVRLNADGSVDKGFGDRGIVIDRRLNSLRVVAIGTGGRILAGSGRRLGRYLANGQPDATFGEGGIAGEASPIPFANRYGWEGPEALLVRPDGKLLVAGPRNLSYPRPQGVVRLYNADGSFAEVVGFVPESGPPPFLQSVLSSLALEPDGSVAVTGSAVARDRTTGSSLLLGKLVPGSAAPFDPSFGAGESLVRSSRFQSRGSAIVQDADKLVVAGAADGTFLLARFDDRGMPDSSFGQGGYAVPAIEGTSGGLGTSEARSVAVQGDGGLIVAGDTTKWAPWSVSPKAGPSCEECPQALVARFTPSGVLDPGFGVGGVIPLTTSSGKPLLGEAEQVASLADGKILVQGSVVVPGSNLTNQFLTRLNADGSLDRSFGDEGLVRVRPQCLERSFEKLRRKRCIPAARIRLRSGGLSGAQPTLSLRVKPSLPWARIATVRIQLPPGLRATAGFEDRVRAVAIGGRRGSSTMGPTRYFGANVVEPKPGRIAFNDLGEPRVLDVRLRPGALRALRRSLGRTSAFRVTVRFLYEGARAGRQTLIVRSGA